MTLRVERKNIQLKDDEYHFLHVLEKYRKDMCSMST